MRPMTFEQFQRTGRDVPDLRVACPEQFPDDAEPIPGRVYHGGLWVQDHHAPGVPALLHMGGRWFTVVGNADYVAEDDGLADIERPLYEFGRGEDLLGMTAAMIGGHEPGPWKWRRFQHTDDSAPGWSGPWECWLEPVDPVRRGLKGDLIALRYDHAAWSWADSAEHNPTARVTENAPEVLESCLELFEWLRSHTGPRDGTHAMLVRAHGRLSKALNVTDL